ncbi:hypothetical protein [Hutsoniella sourekii]|uniref:hypothetical protein n=1 Tax=Hutsoniella sourekii TaxID=87650 RepID=UPI000487A9EA|nr:hypothetical protein [Hutsoniella sourekii]
MKKITQIGRLASFILVLVIHSISLSSLDLMPNFLINLHSDANPLSPSIHFQNFWFLIFLGVAYHLFLVFRDDQADSNDPRNLLAPLELEWMTCHILMVITAAYRLNLVNFIVTVIYANKLFKLMKLVSGSQRLRASNPFNKVIVGLHSSLTICLIAVTFGNYLFNQYGQLSDYLVLAVIGGSLVFLFITYSYCYMMYGNQWQMPVFIIYLSSLMRENTANKYLWYLLLIIASFSTIIYLYLFYRQNQQKNS